MFVAVYLLLLSEGQVLLLRRHNTGYEDGNYSVIAGHVNPGECLTQALVREAAEEAGIQLDEEEVHFVHVIQRKGAYGPVCLDFFFLAEHWQGQMQNCEPSKCDDLQWVPLIALPTNTIPCVRAVLETLHTQASRFSAYGWGSRA
jgi:8-oxo-dGTP pyrophosphatase MutT (NUDIX family)